MKMVECEANYDHIVRLTVEHFARMYRTYTDNDRRGRVDSDFRMYLDDIVELTDEPIDEYSELYERLKHEEANEKGLWKHYKDNE